MSPKVAADVARPDTGIDVGRHAVISPVTIPAHLSRCVTVALYRLTSNTDGWTWAMARLGNGMEFGQGMARRDRKGRWRFWGLALLWLPAGVVGQAIVRFGTDTGPPAEPGMWLATVPMMAVSLVPVAPCGLPLALGCRRLWWLGYPQPVRTL